MDSFVNYFRTYAPLFLQIARSLQGRPLFHLEPATEREAATATGRKDRALAVSKIGKHGIGGVGKVLFMRDEQHISPDRPRRQKLRLSTMEAFIPLLSESAGSRQGSGLC